MNCSIDGCLNEAGVPGSARGWCRAHYRRWQRYGKVDEPLRRVKSWKGTRCAIRGCESNALVHGLCGNHYAVQRRRSDPRQAARNLAWKARFRRSQELAMGRPRPDRCEMCGEPPSGRGSKKEAGICFDHDHFTGKPRGWLCDRCNKVLGLVQEDRNLLRKMIRYLERHDGKADSRRKEEPPLFAVRRA